MSITSANALLVLSIAGLFNTPQQIQGFAVEDVFDVDPLASAETLMGVDGKLSGGFVYVPIHQMISLQADSPSNFFFDTWWTNQNQIADLYFATGNIVLSGIGRKYALNNGILTTYPPIPDAKKVLQPRKYAVTWESIVPANV